MLVGLGKERGKGLGKERWVGGKGKGKVGVSYCAARDTTRMGNECRWVVHVLEAN